MKGRYLRDGCFHTNDDRAFAKETEKEKKKNQKNAF